MILFCGLEESCERLSESPLRNFEALEIAGMLRRRFAIEPIIEHMKAEGHLGRCYPKRPRWRLRRTSSCQEVLGSGSEIAMTSPIQFRGERGINCESVLFRVLGFAGGIKKL